MLVLGYTDSTGSEEVNQQLSEKRASRVVNYLQQACGWKPYRMLTPTGMAEADPLADNHSVPLPLGDRRHRHARVGQQRAVHVAQAVEQDRSGWFTLNRQALPDLADRLAQQWRTLNPDVTRHATQQ